MAIETNKAVVPKEYTSLLTARSFTNQVTYKETDNGSGWPIEESNATIINISDLTSTVNFPPFDVICECSFGWIPYEEEMDHTGGWGSIMAKYRTYPIRINIDSNYLNHYRFFRFVLRPNINVNVIYNSDKPGSSNVNMRLHLIISVDGNNMDDIYINIPYTTGNINTYIVGGNTMFYKNFATEAYSFIYDALTVTLWNDTEKGIDTWGTFIETTSEE